MTKVSFYTLGCRSNQYETDRMIEQVRSLGYELVPYPQAADIYVINTCTVTSNAAKKSRNAIRHSKRMYPNAKVIFTGCDAEIEKLGEADMILTNKDKKDIIKHIRSLMPNASLSSIPYSLFPGAPVRANLMIEDGCQNNCSYCIVPRVRGKVRTRPMAEVIAEAERMVASGVKEIVLTGINLGEFPSLPLLVTGLSKIEGLLRLRLSSIEPQYVTDKLIDLMATTPKVCHHLHIPLQSGDDGILKAMNRRYISKQYLELAGKIRKKMKDVAITTDIIVGFPGEDEKAFKNTCKLVDNIKFSRIHVFSYSDRPGTAAMQFKNKVDSKEIRKRYEKLCELRDKHILRFHRSFKGKLMEVLVEQRDKKSGVFEGMTGNYIRVFISDADDGQMGKIVKCRFRAFKGDTVTARMIP